MDEREATEVFRGLMSEWHRAVYDSLSIERFLADDYTKSAHPFPDMRLTRQEVIDTRRTADSPDMSFVSAWAQAAGDVIIGVLVTDTTHPVDGPPSPGMPSMEDFNKGMAGTQFASVISWRNEGGTWKCFDHHIIGAVG